MIGQEIDRDPHHQEQGRVKRQATAGGAQTTTRDPAWHHETTGDYYGVIARLCARHRIIVCKDQMQWILQRRDGERHGWARWAGVGYFLTREALIRSSRALCARIDPAALETLAALPEHFGRPST